jgi:hypothetical protein
MNQFSIRNLNSRYFFSTFIYFKIGSHLPFKNFWNAFLIFSIMNIVIAFSLKLIR